MPLTIHKKGMVNLYITRQEEIDYLTAITNASMILLLKSKMMFIF